ncbi:hypothetical protein EYF80_044271 [Liparis tanakae]|uniref:Uncharacterized protein n=1 Tax=Liparis tanakae TaxID=230148 RepID=A0A4Z2FWB6_9TELE|nr:hypothetical protein EYF80_044271 [Liparis tanakae]
MEFYKDFFGGVLWRNAACSVGTLERSSVSNVLLFDDEPWKTCDSIGLIGSLLVSPSCSGLVLSSREAEGRPILPSCGAVSLDMSGRAHP